MAEQTAEGGILAVTTAATGARDKWFRRLLYIPTLGFLITMTIFPLLYSLVISLFRYTIGGTPTFDWFGNYATLFQDPGFWQVTLVTAKVTVLAVSIEMILGVLLGFALHQELPGMAIFRLIIFLPMMLAPLVVGLFWRFLLDQTFGLVDFLLVSVGFEAIPWLIHPNYALISVIVVDVWQWTPFVVLLALAGLGTVPADLLEAAELDRASAWMKFQHIYWPHMRFPLLLALTFRSIDTLKLFDTPFVLTGGGPGDMTTTLSLLGYRYHFQFFQIGTAAAISWVVVIIINVVANILVPRMQRTIRSSEEAIDTGL